MALVNWGFFHSMDMKKFLKNLLWNHWSDFEIISQEYSLGDPFKKLFVTFWSVYKHGSGEWGLFTLYRHEEIFKSQKLLVRFWNNFTGSRVWHKRTSQLPIQAVIATASCLHHLWACRISKIFSPLSSIRVPIADTSSFWSLESDKQMDIKLLIEFF